MELIAQLPEMAVYVIVGVVLCGLTGAIGAYVSKTAWLSRMRYLPIAGLGLTPPVSSSFVLPMLEDIRLNAGLPKKVDDVTTLNRVSLSGKNWVYSYSVSDPADAIPRETLKLMFLTRVCAALAPGFAAGTVNSVTYSYDFRNGQTTFDVFPSECI